MKTRADIYGKEANSILRDITMYRAMTKEQIFRFYPGKRRQVENLLSYMVKQGRIHFIDGLYCAAPECAEQLDRGLLAAVWVLADFIDQVEFHSLSDYPTQIIFYADELIYEIVYVPQGKEVLMSNVLAGQKNDSSKYFVLVDHPDQIEQIHIKQDSVYCTVTPEGEVQYYQKG